MDRNDLETQVKDLIRSKLKEQITQEDLKQHQHLQTETIINFWLTDIMALAYNLNINSAIKDISDIQKQIPLISVTKSNIENRVKKSSIRFLKEIEAFKTYHKMNLEEQPINEIIKKVKSILS